MAKITAELMVYQIKVWLIRLVVEMEHSTMTQIFILSFNPWERSVPPQGVTATLPLLEIHDDDEHLPEIGRYWAGQ